MTTQPTNHPRGSAMSLMIIVSVILTGLVMTLAWAGSIHATTAGQLPKVDAAFYAAEAGAQAAIWKFRHDNQWRAPVASAFTGSINMYNTNYNYSAVVSDSVGDATLAWKFDENTGNTTVDSSGHGNTGTFHGGCSWDPNGRSGSAVKMDGVDGYIDCGNNPSTNVVSDMTFSVWIKMNSAYYDQKIGGNQSGSSGGYKLCIYNTKAEFEVRDASNVARLDRDVPGGTILTLGTWYHICGVYSETNHTISTYVNGKFDRQLTGLPVGALATTSGRLVMGREPWDASLYYFNGSMDDIRIYDRALSATEVKSLYDTSVDIVVNAYNGTTLNNSHIANQVTLSASIPTPPAPTVPTITTAANFIVKNCTINGDLSVVGKITAATPASTVDGNVQYTNNIASPGNLDVTGTSTKVGSIALPTVNYTFLKNDATAKGLVVNGDSSNQNFSFNSLNGCKVVWIKGNLTDPTWTGGGTYAAGGTIIVDGTVTFTKSVSLGSSGYPIYIIAPNGNVSHTGGTLTLIGSIYTDKNFSHKTVNITGPIYVKGTITNNAAATCTFANAAIPWFDNRALPQSPTMPLYTSNYRGIGP